MNIKLFKQICKADQYKLKSILTKFLISKGYEVINKKEYIVAKGNIPICLVAHLDTVGLQLPQDIFHDKKNKVLWSPQLLGADDRAGVYAIIQIIEDGYRPHIVFTTDEEIGCLGTQALVLQEENCPLENLKAIFQLDRRGSEDCVFYECGNPDFTKFVESYGFKTAYGSFSDISILAPAWGVAAANLSVGYYNEHMPIEYLRYDELENTILKVEHILDDAESMLSYSYIEKVYPKQQFRTRFDQTKCLICQADLKDNGVVIPDNQPYCVCNECYNMYFDNSYLTV